MDSILNQTNDRYEILIIDGLSKDETSKIINSYSDPKIKIISEADKGIYDAMNKGIALAKGQWLMFLGSDDQLADDKVLSDIVDVIKDRNEKVIYGNVILRGNTGWGTDGQLYDGKFSIEKLLKKNIAHQALFYHRSVFQECGNYNQLYKICADYDLNLRVAAKFKMHYIDRKIAVFNAGGASTSSRDLNFEQDFSNNIIKYFFKDLYKDTFKGLERKISRYAKLQLRQFKFLSAAYLLLISLYFKIRRHIK
ncbi:glycosyltransferase family 2 protein [Mucilaginibacter sp. PAMB04274]|uniref:glycosyltransferase family 2 protein n=1 Tax=Mucilaginibacter sp. PAMB04274 TaxID=3138568 RepID=UPI0031F64C2B